MGQQLSAHQDDDSCFRACMPDKKNKTLKSPATPNNSHKLHNPPIFCTQNQLKNAQQQNNIPLASQPDIPQPRETQISMDPRWQTQTKPYTEVKAKVLEQQKQTVVKQKVESNQQQVAALGLQSKFSSSYKSRTKVFGKTSKASEGGVTRCISQKQVCTSEQTSTKSQQNISSNTRSRNILLNKIEDIKQKYYQRELEIEIYQDENEYQQQLDQLAKIEEKCISEHNQLPLASVREITNIKKNILEKLKQRKMMRNKRNSQKDVNENEEGENPASNEELELCSRNNIRQAEEDLVEQKKQEDLKSSKKFSTKRQKLNKSSRSIDLSQEVSLEQRVQFSIDSQQDTLQQIRQCDQEQQDYKSKVESKMKPVVRNLQSKRLANKNSQVNTIRQSSLAYERNNQSRKSNQLREVQMLSRCSSSKVIRASGSARSMRREGDQKPDNKILFF